MTWKTWTWKTWTWQMWVGTVSAFLLGAVLVVALFPKAADPWAFKGVIERLGLDFILPARGVAFIGLVAEAVLGFALFLLIRHRWVLWPSVGLVAFFVFLTGRHYYLYAHGLVGEEESCGCFGDLVTRSPSEAFWQDLFLLVPPVLLSFLGRPARSAPLPRKRMALVGGLSLGVLIYAMTVSEPEPVLRLDVVASEICVGEGEGEEGRLCLDAVLPELGDEGSDHLIVLTELDDPAFLERLEAFGAYSEAMSGPLLWVLSPTGDERLEAFQFENQPAFEVLAAPRMLVEALSRSLPLAFRVQDGRVTALWETWPPLEELQVENPDSDRDGEYDDGPGSGDTGIDDKPDDEDEAVGDSDDD